MSYVCRMIVVHQWTSSYDLIGLSVMSGRNTRRTRRAKKQRWGACAHPQREQVEDGARRGTDSQSKAQERCEDCLQASNCEARSAGRLNPVSRRQSEAALTWAGLPNQIRKEEKISDKSLSPCTHERKHTSTVTGDSRGYELESGVRRSREEDDFRLRRDLIFDK